MFILKKFKIKHKEKIIYDCIFTDFAQSDRSDIFTTLIIGENGVGKSYLLSLLSDFLRFIGPDSKLKSFKYDEVDVQYQINGCQFIIIKNRDLIKYFKDDIAVAAAQIELPSKLLGLSFMVNDKFSFSNNQDDHYKYLGVRATSNATYTSSIQKKLLAAFLLILADRSRVEALGSVFDFLSLKPSLKLEFRLLRKTLFSREVTPQFISKRISSITTRKKYYSEETGKRINYSAEGLSEFIHGMRKFYDSKESKIAIEIDIRSNERGVSNNDIEFLEMMETLEFISHPEVKFFKGDDFNFDYTSSGEKHFIYTMVNLLSQIDVNSLILIDEPELSLHPRWQMQYIRLLKNITKDFSSCHCILASHSHFMVSDLDPLTSSLMSLSNERNKGSEVRISRLIKYDTYAWSAENILYEVFRLRTTRNFYFERDLSELLEIISTRSNDITRAVELHRKLSNYVFDKNDPINVVLEDSRIYLEGALSD